MTRSRVSLAAILPMETNRGLWCLGSPAGSVALISLLGDQSSLWGQRAGLASWGVTWVAAEDTHSEARRLPQNSLSFSNKGPHLRSAPTARVLPPSSGPCGDRVREPGRGTQPLGPRTEGGTQVSTAGAPAAPGQGPCSSWGSKREAPRSRLCPSLRIAQAWSPRLAGYF